MISSEFLSLLEAVLTTGYQSSITYYSYYGKGTFPMALPTNTVLVFRYNGEVVGQAQAKVVDIVQGSSYLSITYEGVLNADADVDEVELWGAAGATLLYKVATYRLQSPVSVSSSSPFDVLWDIVVSVSGAFTQLPYLLVSLFLVPNAYYTVQTMAPDTPLAKLMQTTPQVTQATQLGGVDQVCICNNVVCAPVQDGVGEILVIAPFYSSQTTFNTVTFYYSLAGSQVPVATLDTTIQSGNAYKFQYVVTVE